MRACNFCDTCQDAVSPPLPDKVCLQVGGDVGNRHLGGMEAAGGGLGSGGQALAKFKAADTDDELDDDDDDDEEEEEEPELDSFLRGRRIS